LRSRRLFGNLYILTGLLLIAAALFLIARNMWDEANAGNASAEEVMELIALMPKEATVAEYEPGYEKDLEVIEVIPPEPMKVEVIKGYKYIGVIEIPEYELTLPVRQECDVENLKSCPCLYSGNVHNDTMTLCAHNFDTQFGLLRDAPAGTKIYFSTVDGVIYKYEVIGQEIIGAMDIDGMTKPSLDWDLTLFTCTTGGQMRVAVRCARVSG
jgi:sortase A